MVDFIGVKIALINNGKLLIIQRDNKAGLPYAGLWDFPGGAREGDETPEECVIREVYEELGIKLGSDQIVWKSVHPGMQNPNLSAYFMVAEIPSDSIKHIVFGNEGQGWKMVDIAEFENSQEVVEPLKGRLKKYLDATAQV